jgi:hypothetical protein
MHDGVWVLVASEGCVRALAKAQAELTLETAGVEFIDENGGGLGVRLRKRQGKKA